MGSWRGSTRRNVVLYTFCILLATSMLRAQTVGLALSGGGAKGLAHIGVIKALEENEIPIDYITGTSIGSIVGMLYCIGYSPDEMIEVFKSPEFKEWQSGIIPEKYKYYIRDYIEDQRMLTVSIKKQDSLFKLILPSHLLNTSQMDLAFMRFTAAPNGKAHQDFNNLFRPFRCVASDVYNKRAKIFRSGDLGQSVRASMTYPFLFQCLEIDDIIYFDGGLYNNFPWNVLREDFHPDVVIGSNVSGSSLPPKKNDLLGQIEMLVMNPTEYTLPDSVGIGIDSHFSGIGILDFNLCDSLVAVGYNHAMQQMPQIRERVARRYSPAALTAERYSYRNSLPALVFSRNTEVRGVTQKQKDYIVHAINKTRNAFSFESFEQEYYKHLADCNIDRIYPRALYNPYTGLFNLDLSVDRANPLDISVGGNISSRNLTNIFLGIDYKVFSNFSARAFAYGTIGNLYSNAHIGWRQDFPTTIPVYYTLGYSFSRYDYHTTSPIAIFEDSRPPYLKIKDNYFYSHFGFPTSFSSVGNIMVHYGIRIDNYYQGTHFLRNDTPDETLLHYWYTGAEVRRQTLNYKQFATQGISFFVRSGFFYLDEAHTPGSTSTQRKPSRGKHFWYNLHGYYEQYIPLVKEYVTVGMIYEAQFMLKDPLQNYTSDLLVTPNFSPSPLTHSIYLSRLRAHQFGAIGVMPTFQVYPNLYVQGRAFAFVPLFAAHPNSNLKSVYDLAYKNYYIFGEFHIFYQTIVGPVSFSVGYLPDWQSNLIDNFLLSLNFGYTIFNNTGLRF